MSEPTIKRIRIQDLTRQISTQALQTFARATLDANKQQEEARQDSADYELKRKNRRTTMLKPTSIRPLPLRNDSIRERSKYSIIKQSLGNVIFGCTDEYNESMGPKFDCPVYEYKNRRNLTFFPIVAGSKTERLYACVECFHVYCVMTVLRNRLESVPVCKWDELGEDKDPLRFPHYCAHWGALTEGQKIYFKEFHWQYKQDEHKLIEHAFNIGMFVKKMCSYDNKTAKFCLENTDGQDTNSLINYIQGLDYTLKEESNAESFLKCFKALHKNEITTDSHGRIHIEGSFESSQETALTDSQSSQCSNSSQKSNKRAIYAPPSATLSSIQSMQNASSLVTDHQSKKKDSPTIENNLQAQTSQEQSNLDNNVADISVLQDLVAGLNNNADSQQPLFPDLDLKQFVSCLLMSTMNTVNNAQLQVLYDGLRPLVARYSPECLNQFIQMIHKIDRNMPLELHNVKLSTVPQARAVEQQRIITTTIPTQQTTVLPKILRRVVVGGTSSNPITISEEKKPIIIRKP